MLTVRILSSLWHYWPEGVSLPSLGITRHYVKYSDCLKLFKYYVSKVGNNILRLDNSNTPVKWRGFLNCCVCKRSLVAYLGSAITHLAHALLNSHQKFIVAGCFEGEHTEAAIAISKSGIQERAELS